MCTGASNELVNSLKVNGVQSCCLLQVWNNNKRSHNCHFWMNSLYVCSLNQEPCFLFIWRLVMNLHRTMFSCIATEKVKPFWILFLFLFPSVDVQQLLVSEMTWWLPLSLFLALFAKQRKKNSCAPHQPLFTNNSCTEPSINLQYSHQLNKTFFWVDSF